MNILIVHRVGETDDFLLRMTLRCIARSMDNVEHVTVAGDTALPDFLSDRVERIAFHSGHDQKQKRILCGIVTAIEEGAVPPGPFLYSSNDHFYVRRIDADRHPTYVKPGLVMHTSDWYRARNIELNPYKGSLAASAERYLSRGYQAPAVQCHADTLGDTRDLPEVLDLVGDYGETEYGYEPTSPFVVVRLRRDPCELTVRPDIKFGDIPLDEMKRRVDGRTVFSVSDAAFLTRGFTDWMQDLCGREPCIYERR